MKVTAFVGSARKKHTYDAAEKFLRNLQSFGDIEYEIIRLGECTLGTCRGCLSCFNRGEEFCVFRDDRDALIGKIMGSDGVVFATPNYSFNVSGMMKIFLDRLGFLFHRPRFFGRAFTGMVAEGVYGGEKIVKYLDFVGNGLGFNVVGGSCIKTIEPMTDKVREKNDRIIYRQSRRFYSQLKKEQFPSPSFYKMMIFRMARSSIKSMLNEEYKDFRYFREKGWFASEYYYPVRLGPLKKLAGSFFDGMGA